MDLLVVMDQKACAISEKSPFLGLNSDFCACHKILTLFSVFYADKRSNIVTLDYLVHLHEKGISMDDNRRKALDAALSQIERQFGKGAVMRMGDALANRFQRFNRIVRPRHRTWHRWSSKRSNCRNLWTRVLEVKRR